MIDQVTDYLEQVRVVLGRLDTAAIAQIIEVLHEARLNGRTIFLMGNGGSAATASHWANDLSKGASRPGAPRLRVIALTDNVPLITAWANDTEYANIFVEQLANFVRPGDVVIGISGSGNSENVIRAIEYGREQGAFTIGLTGFDGGRLKDAAELCLVAPSGVMEQVEDAHMVVTHSITMSLRVLVEPKKIRVNGQ
jgi:D-sedoheptulose 7-phosphate isomerase